MDVLQCCDVGKMDKQLHGYTEWCPPKFAKLVEMTGHHLQIVTINQLADRESFLG